MIHNIHKRPYFHTISISNPSLHEDPWNRNPTQPMESPPIPAAGGDLASVIRETLDSNQMLPHLWVQEAALQVRPRKVARVLFHTLEVVTRQTFCLQGNFESVKCCEWVRSSSKNLSEKSTVGGEQFWRGNPGPGGEPRGDFRGDSGPPCFPRHATCRWLLPWIICTLVVSSIAIWTLHMMIFCWGPGW